MPAFTTPFIQPISVNADADINSSVEELTALVARWQVSIKPKTQRATIHDLATELLASIFQYLEQDSHSLKAARLACKDFGKFVNPMLFKSVFFSRNPRKWKELHDLCQTPQLAEYVDHLEIGNPKHSLFPVGFPVPPPNLPDLKINSLKMCNYHSLVSGYPRLPVTTRLLTRLHIDTTFWELVGSLKYSRMNIEFHQWRPRYGRDDFQNLRVLRITQEPDKPPKNKDIIIDVLFLLSRSYFGRLQDLRLYFLTTRLQWLLCFLQSCNRDVLRHVRIYRPCWDETALQYPRLQNLLSEFKHDAKIDLECTEPWDSLVQYSEEELTFMIDHDMLPWVVSRFPWESEVLLQNHARRNNGARPDRIISKIRRARDYDLDLTKWR